MASPPIYLDECMGDRLGAYLRSIDVDVLTAVEARTTSNNDEAQLTYATSQGRILVTQNQIDFRRLHAVCRRDGRAHAGIILIPQTVPYPRKERRVRLLVEWVGTFAEHRSQLFAWTDLQQQIIRGFRLPGWDEAIVRDAIGWRA